MEKDFLYPLRRVHGMLHDVHVKYSDNRRLRRIYGREFARKKKLNSKTVFLILTPEHTNLGDHAIAFAETELLQKYGIDYVEITGKQLARMQDTKCLNLMNGHPILINGGGNLGTLWYDVEQLMRNVVSANPRSPIFILPNTMYYEDSTWGKAEYEYSKKIYNAHRDLYFYARERASFEKLQEVYRCVKLVPDMVLSLDWSRGKTERAGCLLCLRNDREKLRTEQDEKLLYDMLRTVYGENVRITDTHALHAVSIAEREQILKEKCMEFRQTAMVVTDRLHGMIFCAITGTPCVVINSRSPKVRGCYEWVKHLQYIQFCDNIPDILSILQQIPMKEYTYDNPQLTGYYESLMRDIQVHI